MTKNKATLLGSLAIFLWSVDNIITINLARIPIFQMLSISWLLAFVVYAISLTIRNEWEKVKQKPLIWVLGTLGICGAHCLMVASLRYAPPAQACTLAATWPILVVVLGGWILNKEKISWLKILGVLVGFIGVAMVLTQGRLYAGFEWQYGNGYLFALLSSVFWTLYVLMTRKFVTITSQMMGMYLGVGGVFALTYHLGVEQFIMPIPKEWLLLSIKGMFTLSTSYFLWDFSIKRGHFALLNTLAYFSPICTIILLSLLGLGVILVPIWIGVILVIAGAILCDNGKK
ncbi:MAG: DMT family transporter [Candidatus Berkiella sp.]